MKIVLIGSGNVATILGRKIAGAGHDITQVFSRHNKHAAALAAILNCDHTSEWKGIRLDADIYIAAIADTAVQKLSDQISLKQKLVVHTAGSVSIDVLKNVSTNYGIIYPLQSLRKEINDFPKINLLVDANTPDNLTLLTDFAKTFGDHVEQADDNARLKLHIAAVIVSNFSNHLYTLAESYCQAEKINFNLLLPLISETANRLQYGSPQTMQTGPAIRHDMNTIQKHLDLLRDNAALRNIFEILTKSIQDFYKQHSV